MTRQLLATLLATLLCLPLVAQDTIVFRKGSTMYVNAEGKTRPAIVHVLPSEGAVKVLDKKTGTEVQSFTREELAETDPELKGVVYTFGKKFRTKTVVGLSLVCIVCGLATMFSKSKWHWITIQNDAYVLVLRASKRDYQRMRLQISGALGVPLEIADDT